MKIDTFSANSLKILEKNPEEFQNKYIYNLSIYKKDERAVSGQKFHSLICSYIKGFDVSKLLFDLSEKERKNWILLEEKLREIKSGFIKTEYSFLIKEKTGDKPYFLTGRFDAVFRAGDNYIIYDWKTLNFPKNPENDLQSVVYLFALNRIYKTEKIKLRYLSIEKMETLDVEFRSAEIYKNKIESVISRLPWFNPSGKGEISDNDSSFQDLNF